MRKKNVPKFQREPMNSNMDNYTQNNRYHGNPNLTDETDVFEKIWEEDKKINEELKAEQSIQKWADE